MVKSDLDISKFSIGGPQFSKGGFPTRKGKSGLVFIKMDPRFNLDNLCL